MTAVVTGIGVVAPNGLGAGEFWKATLEGRSGIAELTGFDSTRLRARLAGQVRDFDPRQHLPARLLPQTDISTRYALAAAGWALADAALDPAELVDYEMSVVTANALGGFGYTHDELRNLWSKGPGYVSVYESFAWFYAVNTGQISIRYGMRGPSCALVAEQAGGLDAVGHARRTIRSGSAMAVAGGVDSALDSWGWSSHLSSGRVSASGYRPFHTDADGHVPGEGGAILIIEDAAAFQRRGGGAAYGMIAGYASTFDPPPGAGRPPGLRRAAEMALADAGVAPRDVDVVFADAAGVPELDRQEAAAIRGVFGDRGVPVTAPKSLTGRLFSGGGPLDVAAALLSIRDGVVPGSPDIAGLDPAHGIDLVGEPRTGPVSTALVLARGRWGFNAAVVIRTYRA
ncbi:putative beta-ketoacyl synthase beta subunit [Actinoplanes missouriensis 431]|uniref:Putative beta-ketoacyl synthase beta subunit n=1 Tax=Actinoplanes missouriensis (strain ATCC 14538 / DSM 43046 / CBS 188.64 / JCM 3121 / NBRC 102363 / NCIMB 12654 / NRRL B-3342 / UNCC 431) TaxID=512565 RepID=I0HB98_ACTM4|nr:ketosynthase chain-length factor [Actinoplanes missouriensis]BAL90285.1 putative beta-ketoacyl synthase beta subunit [Actinoplanes missouriensis 431]